ncbi:DUF5719 family protein [Arthrobacter sp. M4]|uniref:DUF5719 family protein n=1 Tax=Arthrobacter sp. M4 TaxID=218160 RepID=UPI001CDCB12A|nr:DUF5719 family protein [Arthrobacter sp. M4]MCA4133572.1 DUF5719 family protein [Arthrobacter sp. M4]
MSNARVAAGRLRKRLGAMAGILSAVAVLAAAAGAVAASGSLPGPTSERVLDLPLADVPAGRATAVCTEPARLLEGTPVGTDPQFSPVSGSAKSFLNAVVLSGKEGALPGSRITSLAGQQEAEISKPPASTATPVAGAPALKAGVVAQRPVSATDVVVAEALGNQQPAMAALMHYGATDGDLRGTAAAACQAPANDFWIVGADTTVGRAAVLDLKNASGTPATVSLDLYGSKGQVQAAGSRGLLVSPGTTRSVVLAGLAAGEPSLAVHVRSVGGPVAGTIQQSTLRGLTPGGVDFLSPGSPPSVRQNMTGVEISDTGSLGSKSGFQDAVPVLQIAVPGAADAVVQVKLSGNNGQKSLPGGGVVTAKGGSVTQVPLTGVPAGSYTVTASSDVAIIASVRVTKGNKAEDPLDFAWSPAAVRLGSQHVVAVPQGAEAQLRFGAPDGRAKISLSPITADGAVRKADTLDISGGTTATVKVPDKVEGAAVVGYVVSAAGDPAYGAVVLGRDGRNDIAVAAIQPGAAGQEKVPVVLGY